MEYLQYGLPWAVYGLVGPGVFGERENNKWLCCVCLSVPRAIVTHRFFFPLSFFAFVCVSVPPPTTAKIMSKRFPPIPLFYGTQRLNKKKLNKLTFIIYYKCRYRIVTPQTRGGTICKWAPNSGDIQMGHAQLFSPLPTIVTHIPVHLFIISCHLKRQMFSS